MTNITLPSYKELQDRLIANQEILGFPYNGKILAFFKRDTGKTMPEEKLFKALGYFAKQLPTDLKKPIGDWLTTVIETLVTILIDDVAMQQRALKAVGNAPEPKEHKGKHRRS